MQQVENIKLNNARKMMIELKWNFKSHRCESAEGVLGKVCGIPTNSALQRRQSRLICEQLRCTAADYAPSG